ncbi:lysophospholipid acyltransferase family protein [Rhodococcus sp. NPDC004095]
MDHRDAGGEKAVTFLAKTEYCNGDGFNGRVRRWFFAALGQIPVDRRGRGRHRRSRPRPGSSSEEEHPEGTRSPDGRLHRGRTGTVRIAMDTGVPLVPVRITGTRPDPCVPWWCRRVGVEILEPSELAPFRNAGGDGGRAATDAGNPRRLTWSCTMVGWQFLRAGLRARPVLSHWQPRPVERQGFSAPLRWLPCWEQRRSAMPTTAGTACRTWCTSFFSAA